MKKSLAIVLVLALTVVSLAACGASSSAAPAVSAAPSASAPAASSTGVTYPKLNLKISCSGTDLGIDAIVANHMAEQVKTASGGNIQITVFPNAQLAGGNQAKTPELLAQGGSYELAFCSGANLSSLSEKFQTHQVPFLFPNYAAASEKLDTTGGAYYKKLLAEKGILYLGGMHNGLRQLTNSKREIKTPEDIKGLKIRIPSGEVGMKTFAAFGADPVAMNWSEVFTALQQGTVDGQENGYQTTASANLHEVQRYLTEWNWQYDGWFLIANQKSWDGFDAATQKLLSEQATEACKYGRSWLEEQEVQIKKQFKDYGVVITELTPEQLKAFVDVTVPLKSYFVEKYGEEACKAWGVV